jgi:hypothetical protein
VIGHIILSTTINHLFGVVVTQKLYVISFLLV